MMIMAVISHAQCNLYDMVVDQVICNDSDQFSVRIDFEYDEVASNQFTLVGNGVSYGTFAYEDLPIIIENLDGNCTTEYEFVAKDLEQPFCLTEYELGLICCGESCELTIDNMNFTQCEDGQINITAALSTAYYYSSSVTLLANGVSVGTYPIVDGVVEVENFTVGSEPTIEFTLQNPDDDSCSEVYIYENGCICDISNILASIVDCNEDDGTYYVELDFSYNMTSDSFEVGGNSIYAGKFAYADLPVTVGPYSFSENTNVNFLIQDAGSFLCFDGVQLGVISQCPSICEISNVVINNEGCQDGLPSLALNFDGSDLTGEYIVIIENQTFGPYPYSDVSVWIQGIYDYCGENIELTIRDQADVTCFVTNEIPFELCCQQECTYSNITINEVGCSNDLPAISLSFDSGDMTGSYEVILGDQTFGPFEYSSSSQYIDGITESCGEEKQLTIRDINDNTCSETVDIPFELCCEECVLDDLNFSFSECEDGQFYATLNFNYENVSDSFTVRGNGNNYGTFVYGDDVVIGPLDGDCETIYEFEVRDQENDCFASNAANEPLCCQECFRDIEIETYGCNEDMVATASLDFNHDFDEDDTFTLRVNNIILGDFKYSELPKEIYLGDGDNEIEITSSQNCVMLYEYELECNDCVFEDLDYEIVECEDNIAVITFNGNINTGSNFVMLLNGKYEGLYSADDLPITIDNVASNETNTLSIASVSFPGCNLIYKIDPFECMTDVNDPFIDVKIYQLGQHLYIENINRYQMEIYAVSGAVIGRYEDANKVDITNFKTGVYVLRLLTDNGIINHKIFINAVQ